MDWGYGQEGWRDTFMPSLVRFLSRIMDIEGPGDRATGPGAWPHLTQRCDTCRISLPRGFAQSPAARPRFARLTRSAAAGSTPTSLPTALSALLTAAIRYSARTTGPATARRTSGQRTVRDLPRSGTSRAA